MNRRLLCVVSSVVVLLGLALAIGQPAAAQGDPQATVMIESQPDEAALYLGSLAYLADTLELPAGLTAQVSLPPTTIPDSLVILEDGQRISGYRLRTDELGQTTVTWDAPAGDAPREVTLAYLATGAARTCSYPWLGLV